MFRRGCGCLLFLLACTVGLGAAGWYYLGAYRSKQPETFVEINRGMSSRGIAAKLAAAGVVKSDWAFLAVRAIHPRATLQAGEYRFGPLQTPFEVFDKIERGDIFYEVLTVPEGSNKFDIANLLKDSDTIKPADFLTAASDASGIRDLDSEAPSLEGYLFPSTYRVTHKTTGKQLCNMMTTEFRRQFLIAAAAAGKTNVETHRAVTLASLIEKESAVPAERKLVAAVFENRLRLTMPLQCDPTVVYAALLRNKYRGTIYKSDLASDNAYNTYAHSGLPPGPIANPGLTSLEAALQPDRNSYLYFVAKPNGAGSHQFSVTLAEHLKAVEAFRKGAH